MIVLVLGSEGALDVGLAVQGKGVHRRQAVQLVRGDALLQQVRDTARLVHPELLPQAVTAVQTIVH